ncbi:MAG: alpha/beta hydrolase [Bacillota bacterium]|nr:alpha/beta hydrolase [Bacillota bacterium]
MKKGLNFRTQKGQDDYFMAYDKTLQLWEVPFTERYIETSFGTTHCIISGDPSAEPLVLLHAASCGATIWYPNVAALSRKYCVYAIDLITESSKSILLSKVKTPEQCAKWLNETIDGLKLEQIYLCGLSIGGWNAANYAINYPRRVKKLVLLSPVQILAKMYLRFFIKIMRMGLHPTRENVEKYIGWGSANEAPLPDSVIEQFTISVMNVNPNAAFPKMIKKQKLMTLKMPVMILLGKNEFAFDINKAISVGRSMISNLSIDVIENASHLISVSSPNIVNEKIIQFLDKNY